VSFPIAHWPDAHFPNAHWPHEPVIAQGGGGGRSGGTRKFKSWDQRQAERAEQLRKDAEARRARAPKVLARPLAPVPKITSPVYQPIVQEAARAFLDGHTVTEAYNDDEEAMALIMELV
jgi:hypothetical protein